MGFMDTGGLHTTMPIPWRWEPVEPGLIADIDARHYANAASTH
jgi:hypothetical protein